MTTLSSTRRERTGRSKSRAQKSENRWTISRIMSRNLYDCMERHISSGWRLESYLSLSKVFLNQMGIWERNESFRDPKNSNFIKVLVVQVMECRYADGKMTLRVREVRVVETADEAKERRGKLVAHEDLGRVFHDIIRTGDYLAIWKCFGNQFTGLTTEANEVIELNLENRAERSCMILYRHNTQHSYLVSEHGLISTGSSDVKTSSVNVVFIHDLVRNVYIETIASREMVLVGCSKLT